MCALRFVLGVCDCVCVCCVIASVVDTPNGGARWFLSVESIVDRVSDVTEPCCAGVRITFGFFFLQVSELYRVCVCSGVLSDGGVGCNRGMMIFDHRIPANDHYLVLLACAPQRLYNSVWP